MCHLWPDVLNLGNCVVICWQDFDHLPHYACCVILFCNLKQAHLPPHERPCTLDQLLFNRFLEEQLMIVKEDRFFRSKLVEMESYHLTNGL